MFSKRIVGSARFLRMPISCQALYFHLGLSADDDGVVEAFPIIRMTGCTEDDLRVLVAKEFVQVLNEDLVTYISDWTENNKIRPDRKIDSIYKNLLISVNPDVQLIESRPRADVTKKRRAVDDQWTSSGQPVDGIGEDSIGKDSIGKDSIGKDRIVQDSIDYDAIASAYNRICVSLPQCQVMNDARKKHIRARLKKYSVEQIELAFSKLEASDFCTGRSGNKWKASFDWVTKSDTNMQKVLEGNYDNQDAPKPTSRKSFLDMME